jgi:integrative and conjugative element protein (TIGR02256 family)
MLNEYIDYGEIIPELNEDALAITASRNMFRACVKHKFFELVELRCIAKEGKRTTEILVVDCINDGVPTKNKVGIHYRERIGLVFHNEETKIPIVVALRKDFPATMHQYAVSKDEPAFLCLYFEPWDVVQRSWTFQSHLNRILWWLAETAQETLHRKDQPAEPFYFSTPFEIVLPPDFPEKIKQRDLILAIQEVAEKRMYFGKFLEATEAKSALTRFACLTIDLQPVKQGIIEHFPYNLEMLNRQLTGRGATLFDPLCTEIKRCINETGFSKADTSKTLLILQIPIKKFDSSAVERNDYKAFCLDINLGTLGEACGVLTDGKDGKYYKIFSLDGSSSPTDAWHLINIKPIEVAFSLTNATARLASGIAANTAEFSGVLAGVGALGSCLAEIWYREAWGTWTFIDPDYIKPHNVARHIAKHFQVGCFKVDAVKYIVERTYSDSYKKAFAIADNVTNWSNTELRQAVENADLIIDATTTLSAPRDLAVASLKRSASVFLTPSGHGSVLLLEDLGRQIRLDSLEAQYYKSILSTDWGEKHLIGHQGHLWVGAGCRDVSMVISIELIQLHAANLARQIRLKSDSPKALISIWHVDPESGAVSMNTVPVAESLINTVDSWKILWNTHLQSKVRQLRFDSLPNETGGILLGYVDQILQTIFIVDIIPAPSDSTGDLNSFIRGVEGLEENIQIAQIRTANVVSYIGEWHSHPPEASTNPSDHDIKLLTYLADNLNHDGLSGVMLIVGQDEEEWLIRE